MRLIPIRVGATDLNGEPWLSSFQIWPRDGKNIRQHFTCRGDQEGLFEEIRSHLRSLAA